jgi:RNA polymerase sigma-70 factor, ECF subfamily
VGGRVGKAVINQVQVLGIDRDLDAEVRVERLINENEGRLTRFVRRFVSEREPALDIVQEVFFAAYRQLSAEPARPLTAGWLYKSAANRAISYLRRCKRRGDLGEVQLAAQFHEDERCALSLDLQSALRRLPHEQLSCVMLTTYAGYSSHEVALLLGLRPEAVRQRVSRGLRAMRAMMEPRC